MGIPRSLFNMVKAIIVASMIGASSAQAPSKFSDVDDVRAHLGTILKGEDGFVPQDKEISLVMNADIPANFDVRTAFPDCAEVSGNIRDQSACGSCWAFGSTEAFNDRHCIATGSKVKLSVEDTTANCGFLSCFSQGCNGGQPGQAWNWFKSHGVVTGGDYFDINKGDTCAPYEFQPCAHHVPATDKYPKCPPGEYKTPSLKKCSESKYTKDYSSMEVPQLPLLSTMTSRLTRVECTSTHLEHPHWVGTPSNCSAGALRTARTIGWLRTPGMKCGEIMVLSKLLGAPMSVALKGKSQLDVLALRICLSEALPRWVAVVRKLC